MIIKIKDICFSRETTVLVYLLRDDDLLKLLYKLNNVEKLTIHNKINKMSKIASVTFGFKERPGIKLTRPTGWNNSGYPVKYFEKCIKSVAVLTVTLKTHTNTESIFAILMLLICLYLKGNVNATYLSNEAKSKEIK